MKLVIAEISPSRLDDLCAALTERGLNELIASEVLIYTPAAGRVERYRGAQYRIAFSARARAEIVLEDEQLNDAIDAIRSVAPEEGGAGARIRVLTVVRSLHVQEGEINAAAI